MGWGGWGGVGWVGWGWGGGGAAEVQGGARMNDVAGEGLCAPQQPAHTCVVRHARGHPVSHVFNVCLAPLPRHQDVRGHAAAPRGPMRPGGTKHVHVPQSSVASAAARMPAACSAPCDRPCPALCVKFGSPQLRPNRLLQRRVPLLGPPLPHHRVVSGRAAGQVHCGRAWGGEGRALGGRR